MQKKENGSITLPVPIGGMNNVLPADMISQTQATLTENVVYDKNKGKFRGSEEFEVVEESIKEDVYSIMKIFDNNKNILLQNQGNKLVTDEWVVRTKEDIQKINNVIINEDGVYFDTKTALYYNSKKGVTRLLLKLKDDMEIGSNVMNPLSYRLSMKHLDKNNTLYCFYAILTGTKEEIAVSIKNMNTDTIIRYQPGVTDWLDTFFIYEDNIYVCCYSKSNLASDYYDLLSIYMFDKEKKLFNFSANYRKNYEILNGYFFKEFDRYQNKEGIYRRTIFNRNGIEGNFSVIAYVDDKECILNSSFRGIDGDTYPQYIISVDASIEEMSNIVGCQTFALSDSSNEICLVYNTLNIICIVDLDNNNNKKIINTNNLGEIRSKHRVIRALYIYNSLYIFCHFIKPNGLNSDVVIYKYNYKSNKFESALYEPIKMQNYIYMDVDFYEGKVYMIINTSLYVYDEYTFSKPGITSLFVRNGRLVYSYNSSLYYSAVGDFENWEIGEEQDKALFLEVGYKDGGIITHTISVYGNIIVVKNNGFVYRVAGDYPNWVVNKLGVIGKVTSNLYNYGGSVLLGTNTGLKVINTSQNYGDFVIEDFQTNIVTGNVTHITESIERQSIIFCSDLYVFEFYTQLNIWVIYQKNNYYQIEEIDGITYGLKNNKVYKSTNQLNDVTVQRGLVHNQYNILVKSITLYTDTLAEDTEIEIEFYKGKSMKRILKAGHSKHKFFVTVRLKELQLQYKHKGSIFVNNTVIEINRIGA